MHMCVLKWAKWTAEMMGILIYTGKGLQGSWWSLFCYSSICKMACVSEMFMARSQEAKNHRNKERMLLYYIWILGKTTNYAFFLNLLWVSYTELHIHRQSTQNLKCVNLFTDSPHS